MKAKTEKTFTIGEVAKHCKTTLRALRFYEEKNLIKPTRRGLTRVYTTADRDAAKFCVVMLGFGFTVAEVKLLQRMTKAALSKSLVERQHALAQEILEANAKQKSITRYLGGLA